MRSFMMIVALALDVVRDRTYTLKQRLLQLFRAMPCKLKTFRNYLSEYEIEIHDNGVEVERVRRFLSLKDDA